MRFKFLNIAFFAAALLLAVACRQQYYNADDAFIETQAKKNKYFDGMQYIKSGGMKIINDLYSTIAPKADSALLFNVGYGFTHCEAFYLCHHEVTNKEYREFTSWVRDSILLTLVAQKDVSFYQNKEKKLLNWAKLPLLWKIYYYKDSIHKALLPMLKMRTRGNATEECLDYDKLIYTYEDSGKLISVPVYPDTLAFIKQDPNAKMSYMEDYFWERQYNDYPANGISWHQAVAYCHWRTAMANELPGQTARIHVNFRLPDEKEWEYAAAAWNGDSKKYYEVDNRYFPWHGLYAVDEKGKWLANFGYVKDMNRLVIKYPIDDGGNYTVKIGSYPPNDFNLYDMAGNVAEWTASMAKDTQLVWWRCMEIDPNPADPELDSLSRISRIYNDSIKRNCRITVNDDSASAFKKAMIGYNLSREFEMTYSKYLWRKKLKERKVDPLRSKYLDYNPEEPPKWRSVANHTDSVYFGCDGVSMLRNQKLIAKYSPARIVKGGSWADGLVYILCRSREVYNENTQSSKIGFRVAMDVIHEK